MSPKPHIVAEIACAHQGDIKNVYVLAQASNQAAAEIFQIQLWSWKNTVVPHHKTQPLLARLEITEQEWTDFVLWHRSKFPTQKLFACTYEPGWVEFCTRLNLDGIKIHAGEIENHALLTSLRDFKGTIHLSVGTCNLRDIGNALDTLKRKGGNASIKLLVGMQSHPTPAQDSLVGWIPFLKNNFELEVGYQDHSPADTELGYWLSALALGAGATILEKHLCLERSPTLIDTSSALIPSEFLEYSELVNQCYSALQSSPQYRTSEQLRYLEGATRSWVVNRIIEAGEILDSSNTSFLRSDPKGVTDSDLIFGKKSEVTLQPFQTILPEHLR